MSNYKAYLKNWLKKRPRAYCVVRAVRGTDSEFEKIINAYFQTKKPILVVDNNLAEESELYYMIYRGVKDKYYSGFFAMVRETMRFLAFSETLPLTPVVYWEKNVLYYDESMDSKTENVFEYYFEPVSIPYAQWKMRNRNYLVADGRDTECVKENTTENNTYTLSEAEFQQYARLYKKYFKLNEITTHYLEREIATLFNKGERVIGVHVRGTDFKYQANYHPVFQGFEVFVRKTKELLESDHYDKIFIATDDEEALKLFQSEFGEKLVYYTDCARSTGNLGVHISKKKSPYTLGNEILRDVYTLVACTSLVCGLSQVSFAARYIKAATGTEYEKINSVEMALNSNGGNPGKVVQREIDEASRKVGKDGR